MNWSGKTKFLIGNHSLDYRGDLIVKCVPKERTNARQRKELEAAVAALQRKADKLAPPEPVPPMGIEPKRERVTVRERVR